MKGIYLIYQIILLTIVVCLLFHIIPFEHTVNPPKPASSKRNDFIFQIHFIISRHLVKINRLFDKYFAYNKIYPLPPPTKKFPDI